MTVAERRPLSPLTVAAIEAKLPHPWLAVVEGARLRKLRGEAGLSREVLAWQADVAVSVVARLENLEEGRCLPRTGARLAQALGVDPVALIREMVSAHDPRWARQ
jgi:hypothetical protein